MVPDVENAARELEEHISHPGKEHWKSLGCFIGYLKGKYTIGVVIIKPKVLKAVIFCDSNYSPCKDTRKSVRGLVATLGGKILTCSSNTQRNIKLIITDAEYLAPSA